MKSIEELIAIRNEALDEIRRAQMRIALIDGTITSDPRYVDLLLEWGGAAEAFPDPHSIQDNPFASSN